MTTKAKVAETLPQVAHLLDIAWSLADDVQAVADDAYQADGYTATIRGGTCDCDGFARYPKHNGKPVCVHRLAAMIHVAGKDNGPAPEKPYQRLVRILSNSHGESMSLIVRLYKEGVGLHQWRAQLAQYRNGATTDLDRDGNSFEFYVGQLQAALRRTGWSVAGKVAHSNQYGGRHTWTLTRGQGSNIDEVYGLDADQQRARKLAAMFDDEIEALESADVIYESLPAELQRAIAGG